MPHTLLGWQETAYRPDNRDEAPTGCGNTAEGRSANMETWDICLAWGVPSKVPSTVLVEKFFTVTKC